MSGNVIRLVDVRLDDKRDAATLDVAPGEVVMIVGAAGVGTSRLVAAALGEVALAGGRIEVFGRDVRKLQRSSLRLIRRRIGIVPQDLCLLEDRSAQLNVVLPLEIDGVPRSASLQQAARILAQLDLEDDAELPVDCLGAAARQRVAVARALVREPELVIADHPTSLQDGPGAELVCTALAIAAARGAACIVLGRDPALRMLADRHRWRQLALANGALVPLSDLASVVVDDSLAEESFENVVPFPLAAGGIG